VTSELEALLGAAQSLPWPGVWTVAQLAAALLALLCFWQHARSTSLLLCFAVALGFGAVGAFALGLIYRLPGWLRGTDDLVGAAAWGALAGTSLAFAILVRRRGELVPRALDASTPALGVLLAIGRIGCFLGGCDAGGISHMPWAVRFPAGSPTFREHVARGLILPTDRASLAVAPLQLVEVAAAFAIAWLASRVLARTRLVPGAVFAFGVTSYAAVRLLVELQREATTESVAARLTSAVLLACGAVWIAKVAPRFRSV
jgi:phosphatidylglycerol---prolipoprotein diacylglyceryl transferase